MRLIRIRAALRLEKESVRHLGLAPEDVADPRALGRRLRQLREAQGISLRGMAGFLGCSEWQVVKLEAGRDGAPMWMVAAYLEMLGYELVLVELKMSA